MASTKISALPGATTLTGAESIPVVQGGVTKKVTTDQFLIKDASGNVGLGVTPSAVAAATKTLQFEYGSGVTRATGGDLNINNNAYNSASNVWKYHTSGLGASRYQQDFGTHKWLSAPSGTAGATASFTTAMTLDASGNLGLGVTPSAWTLKALDVSNSASFYGDGSVWSWVAGVSQNAYFDGAWKYRATGHTAERYEIGAGHSWYTAPSGTAGNPISFTQAMTLDASGNLLVGTTSTGINDANCFTHNVPAGWFGISHVLGTASGTEYINFGLGGVVKGSITQNGTTGVNYNTSSDARLKENIAAADNGSALIDGLQVRKFDWKSDGSHQRFGFVAQELDAVYPEAVSKPADPDEMMGVDYSKLVPLLVQEIQSLRARVAALETV